MHRLWVGLRALAVPLVGAAKTRRPAKRGRPGKPDGSLFLGLRDFGPWWAELYRVPGEPVSYLVQLLAGHGCRPDFKTARLEFGGAVVVLATTGARLFAPVPTGVPSVGELRLVAEQRDGIILTALWQ